MVDSRAIFALEAEHLTFRYFSGARPAIEDISMKVGFNRRVAILGPTGAGKTTLLQVLAGVSAGISTSEASGSVTIGAERFQPIPAKVLFPRVGYVMHDPSVQLSGIHETVEEEIEFTLSNLGVSPADRSARISEILARLRLLDLRKRNPKHLSGGELQRVILASLVVAKPPILLLDEPANSLDPGARHMLVQLLRSLSDTTILFSDYQIEFALKVADLFLVLNAGRLIFAGDRVSFLGRLAQFHDILSVEEWISLLESRSNARPLRILRRS